MQSWGIESVYNTRRTQKEPTKSGVIGLIAASMGRRRNEPVDDLVQMRFGVRVDQQGEVHRDYQTVKSKIIKKDAYITHRYYIEDAAFLVGLEHTDKSFLESVQAHLQSPSFTPFLGRRACPPTYPLVLGIREAGLEQALYDEPWLAPEWAQKKLAKDLPVYVECSTDTNGGAFQKDVPVSFDISKREFGYRCVKYAGSVHMDIQGGEEQKAPEQHDPMWELRR